MAGQEPESEIGRQSLRTAKNEWAIAPRPRGERAHDSVMMNAASGRGYVRYSALDNDHHAPDISTTAQLSLESFAAFANAVREITGSLALDDSSFGQDSQRQIAGFKGPTL